MGFVCRVRGHMLPSAVGQHLGGMAGVCVSGNCHTLPWQLPHVTSLGCGSPPVPGTSALLLYPSRQRYGHVSLALLCILLMMGTVEHLLVGAPAVPVSSFVRNLSQPHAFVLLGAPLLRVHMSGHTSSAGESLSLSSPSYFVK